MERENDPTLGPSQAARYVPLLWIACAAASGILLDRYAPIPSIAWWLLGVSTLAMWRCLVGRSMLPASLLLFTAIGAAFGTWHHVRRYEAEANHVVCAIREQAQPLAFEAIVRQSPRIVPAPPPTPLRAIPVGDRSRCELELTAVREGATWRKASGSARLIVDGHLLGIYAGDRVRGFANYQRPLAALNPEEFDFAEFERSEGRYCSLAVEYPEAIERLAPGSSWSFTRLLDELRRHGDGRLREHLSRRHAALASAVLLGQREQLDADRNELYLVTGTVHLLAISGLNLGILTYGFVALRRTGRLSRKTMLLAVIAFVCVYALVTDAEPPVLRAAVLITLASLAHWNGRAVSPWNTLGGAALAVAAYNPASLFHVGAQLSFLAVAILTVIEPWLRYELPRDPLDRLIATTRPWPVRFVKRIGFTVWQVFAAGALVWLFTAPLVWLKYHLISPIAVVINPLVWLPMSLSLFSGFGVLTLAWLFPPLGGIAGALCEGSLAVMETTIAWSEPLRCGYFWLPAPPWWWVAIFYLICAIAVMIPRGKLKPSYAIAAGSVWSAAAFFLAMPPALTPRDDVRATFVSVGHGAAIVLELPGGKTLLYDCGRLGAPLSAARPISSVLWSRGITRLDAIVISHADSDHYNAVPDLLQRFSVGAIYTSDVMWIDPGPGVKELRAAIERRGTPVVSLNAGDRLKLGIERLTIETLHPPRGGILGSDNANSLVLLVEYANRRLLLTGDLEERGLADLLREEPIDCDVLLAPHHGSTRSNPAGLAAWCRPEFVVISGGAEYELDRPHDLVSAAFRQAGAEVLHTAYQGAVSISLSAEGTKAESFRKSR